MQLEERELLSHFLKELAYMDEYPAWWPAQNDYEVLVGAVLTQNTNWKNVEKTLDNFARPILPEVLLGLGEQRLQERIRPSGFYTRKGETLRDLTRWYIGVRSSEIAVSDTVRLRKELLAIRGIGKETADAILNYGFNLPALVIDVYTRRVCRRFGMVVPDGYDEFRLMLQEVLPMDAKVCATFHARIVELAKAYCRKKPLCTECPLGLHCAKGSL